MAFTLEHFPTFPYPPSGMREVEEVERYLTSLHRSMQEFFSLLPRDIKDGISVVDLDDLANTMLSDPNADRIVFWDDGAGVYTWLTANTGLAISGTNLNLSHLGIESLTDPGADRMFFWDDGGSASGWLAPNDFLTISGTNLNVDYVDEDDMVSNSATLLPTQQSVKAYVDNAIHSLLELYLTDTADGDVATYLVMDDVETGQGESSVVLENMGTGDDQEIEQWVTPLGGLGAHTLVTGVYSLHIHAERTDGGRTVQLYWELWTRTSGGSETLRGTSEVTGAVTSKADFNPHLIISTDVDINTTDRIVIKVYANVSATPANDTDITLYMEGTVESHLRMPTPFSTISNIFVRHDLATAANDFLVASGADVFVKKTLAETGAILEGDLQHDNLQGVTANEHIDWTGASDNFQTTGTVAIYGDILTDRWQSDDGHNLFLGGDICGNDGVLAACDYTVALGWQTLYNLTDGVGNVAIGRQALYTNTSADYNVAIGHQPLYNLTTAAYCVAIGYEACHDVTQGTSNIAIGFQTLSKETTGVVNIAIGYQAGASQNTGSDNIHMGQETGKNTTTGDDNIFLGRNAAIGNTTGTGNIAIGLQSIYTNQSGRNNVGIGTAALYGGSVSLGNDNVAIGYWSCVNITTAAQCMGLGARTLENLTSGNYNIGIGYQGAKGVTTSTANIGIGFASLSEGNPDDYNIAIGVEAMHGEVGACANARTNIGIGYRALFSVGGAGGGGEHPDFNVALGAEALYNLTYGDSNWCAGYRAGYAITTGADNICIGKNAGDNITTGSSNIIIGDCDAQVAASDNQLNIVDAIAGNLSTKKFTIGSTTIFANADLNLDGDGCLGLKETTTPTADASYGKVYCKSDNSLYFQDGAGAEHEVVDWTSASANLNTSGTLSCGAIAVNQASMILKMDSASITCEGNTWSSGSGAHSFGFRFIRGRGAEASPALITSGDDIGKLMFTGYYDGSNTFEGARILVEANETWSSGNYGTRIKIRGVSDGGSAQADWINLRNAQVGIGKAPNSPLDINLATADLEIVDAGTAGATEDGWISIEIGGAQHYIRTHTTI